MTTASQRVQFFEASCRACRREFSMPVLILASALAAFCVGCGTLVTRTAARSIGSWDNPNAFAPVYPATCVDAGAVFGSSSSDSAQIGRRIGFFLDFPFSVTFDTLLLPYDIYVASSNEKPES